VKIAFQAENDGWKAGSIALARWTSMRLRIFKSFQVFKNKECY